MFEQFDDVILPPPEWQLGDENQPEWGCLYVKKGKKDDRTKILVFQKEEEGGRESQFIISDKCIVIPLFLEEDFQLTHTMVPGSGLELKKAKQKVYRYHCLLSNGLRVKFSGGWSYCFKKLG
jgi:hypothetical protein